MKPQPSPSPGPYCSNDMSEWWVPIVAVPNRMKAAALVRDLVDPDLKVLYGGVDPDALLDNEHEGDAHFEPPDTPTVLPDCMYRGRAWWFTVEERW